VLKVTVRTPRCPYSRWAGPYRISALLCFSRDDLTSTIPLRFIFLSCLILRNSVASPATTSSPKDISNSPSQTGRTLPKIHSRKPTSVPFRPWTVVPKLGAQLQAGFSHSSSNLASVSSRSLPKRIPHTNSSDTFDPPSTSYWAKGPFRTPVRGDVPLSGVLP